MLINLFSAKYVLKVLCFVSETEHLNQVIKLVHLKVSNKNSILRRQRASWLAIR